MLSNGDANAVAAGRKTLSKEDDAKLIFGTVFSLRGMVSKLSGDDNRYTKLVHPSLSPLLTTS